MRKNYVSLSCFALTAFTTASITTFSNNFFKKKNTWAYSVFVFS